MEHFQDEDEIVIRELFLRDILLVRFGCSLGVFVGLLSAISRISRCRGRVISLM